MPRYIGYIPTGTGNTTVINSPARGGNVDRKFSTGIFIVNDIRKKRIEGNWLRVDDIRPPGPGWNLAIRAWGAGGGCGYWPAQPTLADQAGAGGFVEWSGRIYSSDTSYTLKAVVGGAGSGTTGGYGGGSPTLSSRPTQWGGGGGGYSGVFFNSVIQSNAIAIAGGGGGAGASHPGDGDVATNYKTFGQSGGGEEGDGGYVGAPAPNGGTQTQGGPFPGVNYGTAGSALAGGRGGYNPFAASDFGGGGGGGGYYGGGGGSSDSSRAGHGGGGGSGRISFVGGEDYSPTVFVIADSYEFQIQNAGTATGANPTHPQRGTAGDGATAQGGAGSPGAIYLSTDGGSSWTPYSYTGSEQTITLTAPSKQQLSEIRTYVLGV